MGVGQVDDFYDFTDSAAWVGDISLGFMELDIAAEELGGHVRYLVDGADDEDELALLAEIEGATSGRLVAEERGQGGISAAELVHGVPHAKFINASFAYTKPREPMRFSPPDRGAWYAAIDVNTCIREVGHHLTKALADANDFNAVVEYSEMLASMSGVFVDLRQVPDHPSLNPDPTTGYPAGNAVEIGRAHV